MNFKCTTSYLQNIITHIKIIFDGQVTSWTFVQFYSMNVYKVGRSDRMRFRTKNSNVVLHLNHRIHWLSFHFLVSTYVVCERLSVMHHQAKLPESFDQILQNTLCSGIWFQNTPHRKWNSSQSPSPSLPRTSPPWKLRTLTFFLDSKSDLTQNTPSPPKIENSNFLSRFQIWPYPEHPPPKNKILPRVQVWPYPEHPPPKLKTLTFFLDSKSDLTQNTPPPPSRKLKTLTFFLDSKSDLSQNTPPPNWKL